MFGMGLGELVVVALVAVVVIGPRDLPVYLRRAGAFARKLRVMAGDLRAQSGIDEVLRETNLERDFAEFRKLATGELEAVHRGMDLRDSRRVSPAGRWGESQAIVFPGEFPPHGADAANAIPADLDGYGGARGEEAGSPNRAGLEKLVTPSEESDPSAAREEAAVEKAALATHERGSFR